MWTRDHSGKHFGLKRDEPTSLRQVIAKYQTQEIVNSSRRLATTPHLDNWLGFPLIRNYSSDAEVMPK